MKGRSCVCVCVCACTCVLMLWETDRHILLFVLCRMRDTPANIGDTRDLGSVPGLGRSLEKEMTTHSRIPAWRIPWTEEPGRLQALGSQRVWHDWVTEQTPKPTHTHTHTSNAMVDPGGKFGQWWFWHSVLQDPTYLSKFNSPAQFFCLSKTHWVLSWSAVPDSLWPRGV